MSRRTTARHLVVAALASLACAAVVPAAALALTPVSPVTGALNSSSSTTFTWNDADAPGARADVLAVTDDATVGPDGATTAALLPASIDGRVTPFASPYTATAPLFVGLHFWQLRQYVTAADGSGTVTCTCTTPQGFVQAPLVRGNAIALVIRKRGHAYAGTATFTANARRAVGKVVIRKGRAVVRTVTAHAPSGGFTLAKESMAFTSPALTKLAGTKLTATFTLTFNGRTFTSKPVAFTA